MKYQSDYPGKFTSPERARQWCSDYYRWANADHHHQGLNAYTPEQVFTSAWQPFARFKQAAFDERYQRNPERFVNGRPKVKVPPAIVTISPIISTSDIETDIVDIVNFPTLRAAGYQANAT